MAFNQTVDVRSAVEYLSRMESRQQFLNGSEIMTLLGRLSVDQRSELYRHLGVSSHDEFHSWLQGGRHVNDTGDYEQKLMQYATYRLHTYLLLYVPPALILLGTFGNVFSFFILKTKAMLKFSTYFFLMLMAVTDTMVLFVGLLPLWVSQVTGFDLRVASNLACKVSNSVGSMVSDYSVWLIIAVSVERYLVVCHPFKASALCSADTAKRLAVVLMIAFFLLNVHFLWTVEVVHYGKIAQCSLNGGGSAWRWVKEAWPWIDALVYSVVPFFVILIFNALIARHVLVARRRRNELQTVYQQRRPSQEGSTRLTLMLLTVSLSFLTTTFPMTVLSICAEFWNSSHRVDPAQVASFRLKRTVTELLMYANHSMNFYLYCATGQKFRHQLAWMVCYRHPASAPGPGRGTAGDLTTSLSKVGSTKERVWVTDRRGSFRRWNGPGSLGGGQKQRDWNKCREIFSVKMEDVIETNICNRIK